MFGCDSLIKFKVGTILSLTITKHTQLMSLKQCIISSSAKVQIGWRKENSTILISSQWFFRAQFMISNIRVTITCTWSTQNMNLQFDTTTFPFLRIITLQLLLNWWVRRAITYWLPFLLKIKKIFEKELFQWFSQQTCQNILEIKGNLSFEFKEIILTHQDLINLIVWIWRYICLMFQIQVRNGRYHCIGLKFCLKNSLRKEMMRGRKDFQFLI
mgnify:CR=1 FL=1